MKKRISLILMFSILVSVLLTACADTAKPNKNGTEDKKTVFDSLPNLDFEGKSVDFLSNVSLYSNARNCFEEEELTAGSIESAVYERNTRVSAAFNVKFSETYENTVTDVTTLVDNLVFSNDDSYDIICIPARYMLDLAANNYLYTYDELYHVNYRAGDEWIHWVNEVIQINGVNFFGFSDAMLSLYDFTHMMLFNTKVLEEYRLTSPYEHVDNDTWTYETMYSMMRKVSSDLNGNGKNDDEDMYGYTCSAYSVLPNFWISAGAVSVKKIPKGYFMFDLEKDVHFDTVYREIFRMFNRTGLWNPNSPPNDNRYYDTDLTFQTNHALFADHTFYSISQLRDMDSDFGIVPYPKWDRSQEQYYSRVEAGTKTWGVLFIQDPLLTGTVIQALSLDAHEYLLHTYYDVTLQLKLTRDDKSVEMLDLIRDTMTYDPGDTLFCDEVRNGIFKDVFKNGKTNLASMLATESEAIQSKINEKNNYFKDF